MPEPAELPPLRPGEAEFADLMYVTFLHIEVCFAAAIVAGEMSDADWWAGVAVKLQAGMRRAIADA